MSTYGRWPHNCDIPIFRSFRHCDISIFRSTRFRLAIFSICDTLISYIAIFSTFYIWYTMRCQIFVTVILTYLCWHLLLDLLLFAMWHLLHYCCTWFGEHNRVVPGLSSSWSSSCDSSRGAHIRHSIRFIARITRSYSDIVWLRVYFDISHFSSQSRTLEVCTWIA